MTPWIAASALFAGLTTYYTHQAFTLGRRTGLLLLAMSIPVAANVGLNLVLIPRLGLEGAMIATTASYGLGLAASIGLGRFAQPLPLPLGRGRQGRAGERDQDLSTVSRLPEPRRRRRAGSEGAGGDHRLWGAGLCVLDIAELRTKGRGAIGVLRTRVAA